MSRHPVGEPDDADLPVTAAEDCLVQPAPPDRETTASAVSTVDEVAGVEHSIAQIVTKKVAAAERDIQALLGDATLIEALRRGEFEGRLARRVKSTLCEYGVEVLRAWIGTGRIYALTAARGYDMNPTEDELLGFRDRDDDRTELAMMTVAVTLPAFMTNALQRGGWRPERGAALTTYFMGACISRFPNELRRYRVEHAKWDRQLNATRQVEMTAARIDSQGGRIFSDPALQAASRQAMDDLLQDEVTTKVANLVVAKAMGYTHQETAELFKDQLFRGKPTPGTARAVEGRLHRLHKAHDTDSEGRANT